MRWVDACEDCELELTAGKRRGPCSRGQATPRSEDTLLLLRNFPTSTTSTTIIEERTAVINLSRYFSIDFTLISRPFSHLYELQQYRIDPSCYVTRSRRSSHPTPHATNAHRTARQCSLHCNPQDQEYNSQSPGRRRTELTRYLPATNTASPTSKPATHPTFLLFLNQSSKPNRSNATFPARCLTYYPTAAPNSDCHASDT